MSLGKIQWMVFALGMVDAVLMGTLTLVNKGFDSSLYFVFFVLIVHNALAIPVAVLQLLLNFFVSAAFMIGGILDRRLIADPDRAEKPTERMIVLVAWALCCYGIQMLFEKQKRAEAEATELAVRQERLRTAGRLAAEIAHQDQEPPGHHHQRRLLPPSRRAGRQDGRGRANPDHPRGSGAGGPDHHRTDGLRAVGRGQGGTAGGGGGIGRRALLEVFPPAAKYQVKIHRHYAPALPALLMQKRHLSGVLVNLLQNAREAMHGRGQLRVSAAYGDHDSVRILIEDDGPGIPLGQDG